MMYFHNKKQKHMASLWDMVVGSEKLVKEAEENGDWYY